MSEAAGFRYLEYLRAQGLAEAKLAAIKPKQSTLAGLSILKKVGRLRRNGAEKMAAAGSS